MPYFHKCLCRRLRYVVHAPHVCGAPRKRRCARTRFTQLCAWAASVIGVRGARCAPFAAWAWQSSPRALTRSYIGARLPASSYSLFLLSLHETLSVLGFVFLWLCGFVLLRLCPSLCFALLSALLFSELCSSGSVCHARLQQLIVSDFPHCCSSHVKLARAADCLFNHWSPKVG